jgi:hypothetical protein
MIGFVNSIRTISYINHTSVKIEPVSIIDQQLKKAWGDTIYRILLINNFKTKSETFKVTIQ